MPLPSEPDGGTGGGTTTSVCTISPADEEAVLGNIIKRVSDIEKFLSRLVAKDVYASNLSELAENLGNILNGTLMLPDTGYSPYGPGGSIPVPDDFTGTYVSGNVITHWDNGVVTFEVLPGQGVSTGGSSITSYLLCEPSTNVLTGGKPNISTINDQLGSAIGTTNLSSGRIDILETGFYWASIKMLADAYSTTGYKYMEVTGYIRTLRDYLFVDSGYSSQTHKASYSLSFGFLVSTLPYYFDIVFSGPTSLMASEYQYSSVDVVKLRGV